MLAKRYHCIDCPFVSGSKSSSKWWPNTHLIYGSVQGNQLSLPKIMSDFPVMWSALSALDKVSNDVAPIEKEPSLYKVYCSEYSYLPHEISNNI